MSQIKSHEQDGVHIITLPMIVDYDPQLEVFVKDWLQLKSPIHILDLSSVVDFKEKAYRPFVLFHQGLKASNRRLFALNTPPKIALQFSQGGLSSVLSYVKSKEEAIAKARGDGGRPLIDVEFINPFITATKTVLETQANTQITSAKPYVKKAGEPLDMQIAGLITLSNPAFTGSITICFRQDVFLKIYENMVGEKHDSINQELEDAAGELLNIIFGQAKTILNDQKGYTLEKAIPTILSGQRLSLRHQSLSPVIILPFESSVGSFHIEVLVDKG